MDFLCGGKAGRYRCIGQVLIVQISFIRGAWWPAPIIHASTLGPMVISRIKAPAVSIIGFVVIFLRVHLVLRLKNGPMLFLSSTCEFGVNYEFCN